MALRRGVALVALLALLAAGCTGVEIKVNGVPLVTPAAPLAAAVVARPGFDTPEAAITHYMAGVAHNDATAILEACAIHEMAHGYDFAAEAARLNAMLPVTSLAPAQHPLFAARNEALLTSRALNWVTMLTYGLFSAEKIDGSAIIPVDAQRVSQFVADVDPARLAGIAVEQIGTPRPTLLADARYQKNAAAQATVWGADELTERVALFTLDGQAYLLGFTLLRYGETWKIAQQVSNIAGTSVLGTAEPITAAQFAALISED